MDSSVGVVFGSVVVAAICKYVVEFASVLVAAFGSSVGVEFVNMLLYLYILRSIQFLNWKKIILWVTN